MEGRLNRREALAKLLAAGGVVLGARPAGAQEPTGVDRSTTETSGAGDLRVLFFNTHLLPSIAQSVAGHRGQDDYRTQAIASKLSAYDLVGLCEVFEARRRQEIIRVVQAASGDAYSWVEAPEATGRHLICGGLLLLTRLAIEGEPHGHVYSSASRVYNSGLKADGLAAKAVIHARLRVGAEPDMQIDCFLTHLESVSPKARARQIEELAAFIAEHAGGGYPLLLMGDLNVTADYPAAAGAEGSEYRLLLDALRHGEDPLVDVWSAMSTARGGTSDALAGGECRRIDYLFLSPPHPQRRAALEPTGIRVEPFLDANVKQGSLSDHAGLACELALRRNLAR